MSKVLAVIQSSHHSHHLVLVQNGEYFSIDGITTLTDALHLPMAKLRERIDGGGGTKVEGKLVAPVAPETEVWGAGVTYLRSRDARKEESGVPDIYQLVYEADRPELFYKGNARRTVGTGVDIGIRADSLASVSEPEVAIVVNCFKEVIGLTICNDVTARTIEGENPLYLTQAKIYVGSASLGPTITPIWEIANIESLAISAQIVRGSKVAWQAQTSISALHRSFEDLLSYLFRCQIFPDGVILSTGTGIVPPLDISLEAGDEVSITVDKVGTLTNRVGVIPVDIHERTLGSGLK